MQILGILNVTPDSFSDGGEHLIDPIGDALTMVEQGATIIDIGGQSTRPGATLATIEQEIERVIPVVEGLTPLKTGTKTGKKFQISVDTTSAKVAKLAIDAGADIINDVTAGDDPQMGALIAKHPQIKYIAMHSRGLGDKMESDNYDNVLLEVERELIAKVNQLLASGVKREQIILDPGPGFSKAKPESNWALIANLKHLKNLGYPVLVAVSRKRFLGGTPPPISFASVPPLNAEPARALTPTDPKARDIQTAVISTFAKEQGAWGVRVHNVTATVEALKALDLYVEYRNQTSEVPILENQILNCNLHADAQEEYGASPSDALTNSRAPRSEALSPQKTAKITIEGVTAYGIHGVNDNEKIYPQKFVVDCTFWADNTKSSQSDDLSDTVSYSTVTKTIIAQIKGARCNLIEALGARILQSVKALDTRIERVKIALHKPEAPLSVEFSDVIIELEG